MLKKNGELIISTTNPCTIGQEIIRLQEKKIFLVDNYFKTKTQQWEMVPGMLIKDYIRNIEELFNPIINVGFRITYVKEPKPIPQAEKIDPLYYDQAMRRPSFILIEAKK